MGSDTEADFFAWAEQSLASMEQQARLTTLPVAGRVKTAHEFWASIEDAITNEKIDEQGYSDAVMYFNSFFKNGEQKPDFGIATYVEHADGLHMVIPEARDTFDGQA